MRGGVKRVYFQRYRDYDISQRVLEQYQLEITDPYYAIPSLDNISKIINKGAKVDRSKLHIEDLDIVYTIQDDNMKNALNSIMRVLDSVSLSNEEGYMISVISLGFFDVTVTAVYTTLKLSSSAVMVPEPVIIRLTAVIPAYPIPINKIAINTPKIPVFFFI